MSNQSSTLPTPSALLTSIIASLAATIPTQHPANTAALHPRPLPLASKDLLLTLHVCFPHHLLDALDLLDRSLVTRLVVRNAPARRVEYHVRSARVSARDWRATHLGRSRDGGSVVEGDEDAGKESYHVRLGAWHCTCPGFAYAAFAAPAVLDGVGGEDEEGDRGKSRRHNAGEGKDRMGQVRGLGGMSTSDGVPPMCKHLLACVLAEGCQGMFDGEDGQRGVRTVEVSEFEAAGWAAGGWFA
ncbi:hypothetical protein FH972_022230 [Carpinus fangiana]|uniref:SWIM-type domain-containing protein n=1 Tax=Carpinus fangiana TaxID=176857 RepID=A0A5N6KS01_9ROSI|nr:hypothetical protein FH972_022230 [Carpinus fangiana]